jgi:hypothetical protein
MPALQNKVIRRWPARLVLRQSGYSPTFGGVSEELFGLKRLTLIHDEGSRMFNLHPRQLDNDKRCGGFRPSAQN